MFHSIDNENIVRTYIRVPHGNMRVIVYNSVIKNHMMSSDVGTPKTSRIKEMK